MKKLYVIGNGFDLYHGLDTSYQSFGGFLKGKHIDIFDYLIEYYGFCTLCKDVENGNKSALWAEFEMALSDLDFEAVLENNSNYLADSGSSSFKDRDWGAFSIEMQKVVDDLTTNLFKAFKHFILNIEYPQYIAGNRLCLDKDALYLTFNYTDLLQRFYDIPRKNILYIHKKACHDNETLILGHGVSPKTFETDEPKPPEGMNEEEYEKWMEFISDSYEYSYERGKDKLMTYYSKSFKDTKNIIKENCVFFEGIKDIEEIVVLGHSLSEIDKPYFIKILASAKKEANWTMTYHSDDERSSYQERLIDIGVSSEHVKPPVKMNELVVCQA